jgi:hypothetical protein
MATETERIARIEGAYEHLATRADVETVRADVQAVKAETPDGGNTVPPLRHVGGNSIRQNNSPSAPT